MSRIMDIARDIQPQPVKGTYAFVGVSKESSQKLYALYRGWLGEGVTPADDYHITVVYSRVPIEYKERTIFVPLDTTYYELDLFGEKEDFLVLRILHPALNKLFEEGIDNGATWDFPEYKAHISLFKNFKGGRKALDMVPLPDFTINLNKLTVSELED
tara:strand:- start:64 stop:537 length:474 start_codon:yes stop_codon:yes gene_type:complete